MTLAAELLAFDRAPSYGAPLFATELFDVQFAADALSARSYDADRRLHVEVCNISKATVNPYYGREIPNGSALGLDPERIYMLYRDPEELRKAAPTFARLQLMDDHIAVDADNPKLERTAGTVGSDVRFEHPYLKTSLAVWTRPAIDRILARKAAQLSCSYRYRADMSPGVSPEGVAFDGIMRDIIGNHVALVKEGRAGPDVYVNDALPIGLQSMLKFPKLVSVIAAVIPGITEAQKLALDTAFDKKARDEDPEEANDARECALDEREAAMDEADKDEKTEKARGDRKAARDARKGARDKKAADRKAADARRGKDSDPVLEKEELKLKGGAEDIAAAVDAALKAGGYVSRDEAARLANDAVEARSALTDAHKAVAPLVGTITTAMDSAEAVYRFALDKVNAAHKGVHASALPALVSAEIRARQGNATPFGFDAASVGGDFTIDGIFNRPSA